MATIICYIICDKQLSKEFKVMVTRGGKSLRRMSTPTVSSFFDSLSNAQLFLLGIVAAFIIYYQWFNSTRAAKLGNLIPGPKSIPLFGHALLVFFGLSPPGVLKLVMGYVEELMKFTRVGKIWIGNELIVGIVDPEDIEVILGSHVHLEKSYEYKFFEPWLGEGLLISKGEKWRTHRKLIAPTFHKAILRTFVPVFNTKSNEIIEKLRKTQGQEFDVHDSMSTLTVEILLETAMGMTYPTDDERAFQYAKAVLDLCNVIHQRQYKFWLRPEAIFQLTEYGKQQKEYLDIIHSLTKEVFEKKKKMFEKQKTDSNYVNVYKEIMETTKTIPTSTKNTRDVKDDLDYIDESDVGEKKRMAFLEFMIEASHTPGTKLTDQEIKEEVDTIMFEGHDTIAAASSFCLSLLGVHQKIQDKVVEELNEVFQGSNRPVTFEDTLNLKYLERVIMETLRLYPPVPVITRQINEEVKLPSGYTLPAGATILIGIFVLHRDSKIYDEPLKFNPDNFLPENCQNRNFYSFIPFSAGPRGCVGRKYAMLNLKVILANVLRNFKVTSPVEEKDFQLQADIILKRTDGFRIILEERVPQKS